MRNNQAKLFRLMSSTATYVKERLREKREKEGSCASFAQGPAAGASVRLDRVCVFAKKKFARVGAEWIVEETIGREEWASPFPAHCIPPVAGPLRTLPDKGDRLRLRSSSRCIGGGRERIRWFDSSRDSSIRWNWAQGVGMLSPMGLSSASASCRRRSAEPAENESTAKRPTAARSGDRCPETSRCGCALRKNPTSGTGFVVSTSHFELAECSTMSATGVDRQLRPMLSNSSMRGAAAAAIRICSWKAGG